MQVKTENLMYGGIMLELVAETDVERAVLIQAWDHGDKIKSCGRFYITMLKPSPEAPPHGG